MIQTHDFDCFDPQPKNTFAYMYQKISILFEFLEWFITRCIFYFSRWWRLFWDRAQNMLIWSRRFSMCMFNDFRIWGQKSPAFFFLFFLILSLNPFSGSFKALLDKCVIKCGPICRFSQILWFIILKPEF